MVKTHTQIILQFIPVQPSSAQYILSVREVSEKTLNWDMTGCVSSSTGKPLTSNTQRVCAYKCQHADVREGGSGTLYNLFHFFPRCLLSAALTQTVGQAQTLPGGFDYNKHKQTHTCNLLNRRRVCVSLRFPPFSTTQRYFYWISSGTRCATEQAKLPQGGCIFSGSFQSYFMVT